MKFATGIAVACVAAATTSAAWAQEFKATRNVADTQLSFDVGPGLSNYSLTVSGPNGFHSSVTSPQTAPSLDLRRFGKLDDGVYHYELTAMTGEKVAVHTPLDNGRSGGPNNTTVKSVSTSGVIHVKDGAIVKYDPAAREPEKVKRTPEKK